MLQFYLITATIGFVLTLTNTLYFFLKKNYAVFLFSFSCLLYFFYVHFIPLGYAHETGFARQRYYGIDVDTLYLTGIIDNTFIILFWASFHFFYISRVNKFSGFKIGVTGASSFKAIVDFFTVIVVLSIINSLLSGVFFEASRYGVLVKFDAENLPGGVFDIVQLSLSNTIQLFANASASILIVARGFISQKVGTSYTKLASTLAFVYLALEISSSFLTGVRHTIFYTILVYAFIYVSFNNEIPKRIVILAGALFLFMSTVGAIMGDGYRLLLSSERSLTPHEKINQLYLMISEYKAIGSESSGGYLSGIERQIEIRLTDLDTSSALINLYENDESPGLSPTFNSLFTPIPRFVWNGKPAPMSADGTHNSLAGLIVWNELTGANFSNWGGYTASSHHFWEGGVIYVVFWAVVYGFMLANLFKVLKSSYLESRVFHIAVIVIIFEVYRFDSFLFKGAAALSHDALKCFIFSFFLYSFLLFLRRCGFGRNNVKSC